MAVYLLACLNRKFHIAKDIVIRGDRALHGQLLLYIGIISIPDREDRLVSTMTRRSGSKTIIR